MFTSTLLPLVPFLASTVFAATTTTATILIPDWCITQSAPAVTVINADRDLTTYSYSCSVDSSAESSASVAADAGKSRASAALASAGVHPPVHTPNARMRRDNDCYNWNNWGSWNGDYEACIPWEITQGPSIWAVHYTLTGIAALDQECSFGNGGVASGSATCTASGRLDPGVWGNGDGVRTHTFGAGDVERYWIRDVVSVTAGSGSGSGAGPTTTTWTGTGAAPRQTAGAVQGNDVAGSTGAGVVIAMPTGMVAMAIGAGGVLFGALAL